jgi:hypothetical protein
MEGKLIKYCFIAGALGGVTSTYFIPYTFKNGTKIGGICALVAVSSTILGGGAIFKLAQNIDHQISSELTMNVAAIVGYSWLVIFPFSCGFGFGYHGKNFATFYAIPNFKTQWQKIIQKWRESP